MHHVTAPEAVPTLAHAELTFDNGEPPLADVDADPTLADNVDASVHRVGKFPHRVLAEAVQNFVCDVVSRPCGKKDDSVHLTLSLICHRGLECVFTVE